MRDYDQLEKSCMAFKLTDGNIVLIDQADIREITRKIMLEALCDRTMKVYLVSDTNAKKARELYEIMTKEKDMDPEMKKSYHENILWLYTNSGELEEVEDVHKEIEEPSQGNPKPIKNDTRKA